MRSYLSLVPLSARVHRRQSRMTRICIILAVFLVTSIFSMVEMWTKSEITAMRRRHGDWHISLQNMSEPDAEQIIANSDIVFSSWHDEINEKADQAYSIGEKPVVVYGVEETYVEHMMKYPLEGSFPQNETEVALSADAKTLFDCKLGDRITLTTPAGDLAYTISGFYEDDADFNAYIDGACVYMNRAAFDAARSLNGLEPNSQFYLRFRSESRLKKQIEALKQQYNLNGGNIEENTGLLLPLGASSKDDSNWLYYLAIICFVIILIAGVFMISSCMNSNVAQRTQFFGMLRCIGASKQQIMRLVRLEALNWCKTAIPAGCALGTVTVWALCAILRLLVKGEFTDFPLFAVSISGILSGAVVGVITVFIAANAPAKQAARVSPVAAISGNAEPPKKVTHTANTRFFKVETSLGIHHATEAKKNMLLMTGSFALTIILFLVASACFDLVRSMLPSLSNFSPDLAITSPDSTNSIDTSLSAELENLPEVEAAFGTMYALAIPAEINGKETTIDLMSYEEFMLNSTKKSIASGDLSKVYGDSGFALTIFSQDSHLDVGDVVKIGDQTVEIACVATEGIGSVSGTAVVVCSEETFARLTGERAYMMINILLKKGASEATVNQIRNLAGENSFVDRREEDLQLYKSYWVFRLGAYGFLAIVALITVLNIMNSISMSVSARIKQYGAMRAVGMETRQVTKMIAAEAATYAVCGMIVGDAVGLLLHYLFYAKLILSHFGGSWKVPVSSLALILLLVSASCIAAVHAPSKRMQHMAITDTINEL